MCLLASTSDNMILLLLSGKYILVWLRRLLSCLAFTWYSQTALTISTCFYRFSSLLLWYTQYILLISRLHLAVMAGGCLHSTRNPPILCISFRTNILLSGYSYLVNNPCFNAEVKSGLLHQLYYPMFTLGCYGRVVTVFSSGKAKLGCLYSAHNLPVLSITCLTFTSFWSGLLWHFDIQTYIFRLTAVMSSHNVSYL